MPADHVSDLGRQRCPTLLSLHQGLRQEPAVVTRACVLFREDIGSRSHSRCLNGLVGLHDLSAHAPAFMPPSEATGRE